MVLSFDFAQNVSYPVSPQSPGSAYFKSNLKCSIFGILNERTKVQSNFLIDEADAIGKGPNAVISMIDWCLEQHPASEVHAFADNCVSQNKNNAMIHYFAWLVRRGVNRKMSLNFLLTGHTRFGPDRMFGLLKMKYSQCNIDCYEDLVACVNESSVNHHNISVRSTNVIWRQWQDFLKGFYAPLKGIVLSMQNYE